VTINTALSLETSFLPFVLGFDYEVGQNRILHGISCLWWDCGTGKPIF